MDRQRTRRKSNIEVISRRVSMRLPRLIFAKRDFKGD